MKRWKILTHFNRYDEKIDFIYFIFLSADTDNPQVSL